MSIKSMSRFTKTSSTSPHFSFYQFWKENPPKIHLNSKNVFQVPDKYINKKMEYIQNLLPKVPESFRKDDFEFNEKLRLRYTVVIIGWVFHFLKFECEMVEGAVYCGPNKEGVIIDLSLEDYENFCAYFIHQFTLLGRDDNPLPVFGMEKPPFIPPSEIELLLSAIHDFLNKSYENQTQQNSKK